MLGRGILWYSLEHGEDSGTVSRSEDCELLSIRRCFGIGFIELNTDIFLETLSVVTKDIKL